MENRRSESRFWHPAVGIECVLKSKPFCGPDLPKGHIEPCRRRPLLVQIYDLCQPILKRRVPGALRSHYVFLAMTDTQGFRKRCLTAVALEYVLCFSPVIQAAALLHHGPPQPRLKPLLFALAHRLPPLFFASVRCNRYDSFPVSMMCAWS